MKTFRELELRGQHSTLKQIIESIENNLTNGWMRSPDKEKEVLAISPSKVYCFTCSKKGEREASSLWLDFRDDETLYISNIVPQEIYQLNFDQYNLILEEFYNKFILQVAEKFGIEPSLTSDLIQIDDLVTKDTLAKLKQFSLAANKSTGSSHPLDQKRWFNFIVHAHLETTPLNPSILKRWLIEVENWSEDKASQLTIEYEFAQSLLDFYDKDK